MPTRSATIQDLAGGAGDLPGGGLPWLSEMRRQAARQFEVMGLPTRRWEEWKYTPMDGLLDAGFQGSGQLRSLEEEQRRALLERVPSSETVSHVVFLDGQLAVLEGRAQELPPGVIVTGLRQALEETPALLEKALGRCAPWDRHPFAALNTALFEDGLFLYLPAGTVLERPLNVVCLNATGGRAIHLRHVVVAGGNSKATIFESHGPRDGGPHLTNSLTELQLGAGAEIDHHRVQNESDETWHVSTMAVDQERDSRFESWVVSLGAHRSRNEIAVRLGGQGASCRLEGLYLGSGERHLDTHTHVDHAVPLTQSEEYYKGILDDRSTGVFTGRVLVRADSQKADAAQQNRNLLLSRDATVNSRPQLEIHADDVKCSHGATTGQLDRNALFYLRSRGVPERLARSMLTTAFVREIIERVSDAQVRRHLARVVGEYLGAHVESGEA